MNYQENGSTEQATSDGLWTPKSELKHLKQSFGCSLKDLLVLAPKQKPPTLARINFEC